MARNIWRRLARLRARIANEGADALPGDCVQCLWGGPVGWVESISGTCAVVFWNATPGKREIIELRLLKPASADPAFGPDVREE